MTSCRAAATEKFAMESCISANIGSFYNMKVRLESVQW